MFGRLTILLKFSETVLSPDCMWVRTRDGLIHGLQWGGLSGLKCRGGGGVEVCTQVRCGFESSEVELDSSQVGWGCVGCKLGWVRLCYTQVR